jgi:hypothetical protein
VFSYGQDSYLFWLIFWASKINDLAALIMFYTKHAQLYLAQKSWQSCHGSPAIASKPYKRFSFGALGLNFATG